MAQYQVVPFTANILNNEGLAAAAGQLQNLINQYASQGWQYVKLESIEINQAGSPGCFGIGAAPPSQRRYDMVVFVR